MYNLGLRLKAIRKQRGLTQKALGQRINKSEPTISSYESDAQIPPVEVLVSIANVLNVSLDYLVGMDQHTSSAFRDLSPEQCKVMEKLYQEFTTPDRNGRTLTPHQIEIIQQLILLFSSD